MYGTPREAQEIKKQSLKIKILKLLLPFYINYLFKFILGLVHESVFAVFYYCLQSNIVTVHGGQDLQTVL